MSIDAMGREAIGLAAEALDFMQRHLDGNFEPAVNLLGSTSGRVICTGIGKSGHVARKVASTMASTGTPAMYLHPAEGAHGDLGMIVPDDSVFMFSKSGMSVELMPVIHRAKELAVPVVLVSENGDDGLAFHADITIRLPRRKEAWCAAPTTSTIMQMAVGDAVSVALAHRKGFSEKEFRALHPGGKIGGYTPCQI